MGALNCSTVPPLVLSVVFPGSQGQIWGIHKNPSAYDCVVCICVHFSGEMVHGIDHLQEV